MLPRVNPSPIGPNGRAHRAPNVHRPSQAARGVVLVVSCVRLFLLCVCVCDLFLFEQVTSEQGYAPTDPAAVRAALQTFTDRRKPRASAISLLSRLASDLIVNFFDTPWSPHDERGKGALAYLTFAWKPLLQYVVFPLQVRSPLLSLSEHPFLTKQASYLDVNSVLL